MKDILIQFGPITVYSYGLFIALGIVAGYTHFIREAGRAKLDTNRLSNILFWSMLFAFVGAHLCYILLNLQYYLRNPLELIRIEDLRSGYVFLGGLAAGMVSSFLLLKKHKFDYALVMDLASPGLALAYSLGRIGCFLHGCCYGRVSHGVCAVWFPPDSPAGALLEPRIPTQLLSSLIGIAIFTILLLVRDRKRFKGEVFLAFIGLYSITRFGIEFLREDHYLQVLFFDIGQWAYLCILMIVIGLYIRNALRYGCFVNRQKLTLPRPK